MADSSYKPITTTTPNSQYRENKSDDSTDDFDPFATLANTPASKLASQSPPSTPGRSTPKADSEISIPLSQATLGSNILPTMTDEEKEKANAWLRSMREQDAAPQIRSDPQSYTFLHQRRGMSPPRTTAFKSVSPPYSRGRDTNYDKDYDKDYNKDYDRDDNEEYDYDEDGGSPTKKRFLGGVRTAKREIEKSELRRKLATEHIEHLFKETNELMLEFRTHPVPHDLLRFIDNWATVNTKEMPIDALDFAYKRLQQLYVSYRKSLDPENAIGRDVDARAMADALFK